MAAIGFSLLYFFYFFIVVNIASISPIKPSKWVMLLIRIGHVLLCKNWLASLESSFFFFSLNMYFPGWDCSWSRSKWLRIYIFWFLMSFQKSCDLIKRNKTINCILTGRIIKPEKPVEPFRLKSSIGFWKREVITNIKNICN